VELYLHSPIRLHGVVLFKQRDDFTFYLYLETTPGNNSTDFLQKNSYTRDLKSEWWGAPLVQEGKYQGKGTL
jgi:hypothetical protein